MQLGGVGRCRSQAHLELAQLIAAKRMHPHALTDAPPPAALNVPAAHTVGDEAPARQ